MDYPGYGDCRGIAGSGILCFQVIGYCPASGTDMDFAAARSQLIDKLKSEIKDRRVLEVMGHIPRERFVPARLRNSAYQDEPLPIGNGQTISQPLIIAMMTQALELNGDEKVLEIGTGSGYQAAILAELCREVVTTERIPTLAESAARILAELGYSNVKVLPAGLDLGWKPESPYDGIIVTAGSPRISDVLLEQLAEGGKLVIPVGSYEIQQLYQVTKFKERNITRDLGGCRFVPLIGKDGWAERY
ncbi:MAG: protein-L-isoaspartate(D-aspartate) O-methyltransferase [Dehalococcoidales bacterium]|nr:protein-L-isoaspartate(D-aspartate) O-methyltransferase [Dehalococcoidales bacterium]